MQIQTEHQHKHDHHHHQGYSWWGKIAMTLHLPGFSHNHELPGRQDAIYNNELGIRTVKQALLLLGGTTLFQAGIYMFSGSVALLADTIHNLGDALNSIPLWMLLCLQDGLLRGAILMALDVQKISLVYLLFFR